MPQYAYTVSLYHAIRDYSLYMVYITYYLVCFNIQMSRITFLISQLSTIGK